MVEPQQKKNKKTEWLQRAYYDQSKKFPWYHLSKCFVLFIMCVVTYGFQMEFTSELTAVKSNHEARQYLWSESDIIFFPWLCFSASPLLETDIETVLDLMFHCFRPGHWHTLQPYTSSISFVRHIFFPLCQISNSLSLIELFIQKAHIRHFKYWIVNLCEGT